MKMSANRELENLLESRLKFYHSGKLRKMLNLKFIFSKMVEKMAILLDRPFILKKNTFWLERMLLVIPEEVSLNIYKYTFFEEDLTKYLLKYLGYGMTFFDIGAHFGYFTLLASFIVGDSGRVHSFEPTPSTFEILRENTKNKRNVILNNLAVFEKKGVLTMNDYGFRYAAFNSIYSARLPEKVISKIKSKSFNVNCISIDEYVEENSVKPDFIKIDAESSEYKIVFGMKKTINKFHPIVSLEVGDMGIIGVPESKKVVDFMMKNGYQVYEFVGGNIKRTRIKDENYIYQNLLFLPN